MAALNNGAIKPHLSFLCLPLTPRSQTGHSSSPHLSLSARSSTMDKLAWAPLDTYPWRCC